MAVPSKAIHVREGGGMWQRDPRMQRILAQPVGTPIDWSVFTREELGELLVETAGANPNLPLPPKAEVLL